MSMVHIVTYVTYAIVIGLYIWGGKFAGFGKDKFHDDFMSMDVTKSLRGYAAMGVILHHISQEEMLQRQGQLSFFVNAGFFMVAIFFFCSGYGLIKNLDNKPDYLKGFLKKRLPVIVVPFYVSTLFYLAYRLIIFKEKMPPAKIVTGLIGLTMINEYAWYPIILTLLYVAFYILFKFVKNRKVAMTIMLLVILLLGAIFCVNGHFAWWAKKGNWWMMGQREWWMEEKVLWLSGEWWVNSAIAFWIGMLFACNEKAITAWLKKLYWLKLILFFVLAQATHFVATYTQWTYGYWSEWKGDGPHIADKFICYFAQLPQVTFFVIVVFMLLMKYHAKNPVLKFFGKVSLDTYLMNLMALWMCRFIIMNKAGGPKTELYNWNHGVYIVAVFAVTILLGLIFKMVCDCIINILLGRKKNKTAVNS